MKKYLLPVLFLLAGSSIIRGEVRLPGLISDGMILQRDMETRIWGWADPGESVVLRFSGNRYRSTANEKGEWEMLLPPQKAGGPHEMIFRGENEIKVSDILFGDVWVCSGQSNMVLPMERVKEKYPMEVQDAGYPEIRQFLVQTRTDLQGPQDDLSSGAWISAEEGDIMDFSAVAYFFAKTIHERYNVPIGLVNASVGGTPVEAWISEEGLQGFREETEILNRNKNKTSVDSILALQRIANQGREILDQGLMGEMKWFDPDYQPKGWKRINIPGYWEDQGVRNLDGIVWYRKEIRVPASMTGVPAKLFMGRIVDADFVYINGREVGHITYQYPPRRYEIPAGLLKTGKNTIVVRVLNYGGKGGFVPDKPYLLTAGREEVDLKGDWQYKVGQAFEPLPQQGPDFNLSYQPTALYNAMIAPLTGMRIKGFIWYQGEANTSRPSSYEGLLKALIGDWRHRWGEGDLPFLYVQLANYMEVDYLPAESNWAELRNAQRKVLSSPNTAMAVAIDLGEWNDIHPLNKEDVGKRLALAAINLAYGEKEIEYSGPLFRSVETSGDRMILSFDHCGSGLVSADGEPLHRFEIAGADRRYVWASAEIKGNTVEVWSDSIADPVYVRYAWADNPDGANLYNKEGLPASPFRNDDPVTANNLSRQQVRDSINRLSNEDHRQMMEQLGIQELRPGPSGDPSAPNAANTDESKATQYAALPDPLQFNDGKKVESPEAWENRRREIMEDFDREVYGIVPENTPGVSWEVVSVKDTLNGPYPVKIKELRGHVDNSTFPAISVDIQLTLTTPAREEGAVPVIMEFGFVWPPEIAQRMPAPAEPTWQQQLLGRGWGYAILVPTSYQADNGAGLREGIIGLVNKGKPRKPDDWGALRAWAWGAGRAVDYFESDPDVDATRVGIEGLSRYGKAALVTMAYEPRIAIGFIGSSGAGGVKIMRRMLGEQVENLAASGEYHWFAGNFIKYAGPLTVYDLPVDAHELVALCAPRPVFISAGSPEVEGHWVDARGMFLGGAYADPVYELLGRKGLGTTGYPPEGISLMDGEIAFRQHAGGHTTVPNWPYFIEFASKYFSAQKQIP